MIATAAARLRLLRSRGRALPHPRTTTAATVAALRDGGCARRFLGGGADRESDVAARKLTERGAGDSAGSAASNRPGHYSGSEISQTLQELVGLVDKELKARKPDGSSDSTRMLKQEYQGKIRRSKSLEEMLSLVDEMMEKRLEPDASVYSALIRSCGNLGQWKRSLGYLKQMEKDGLSPNQDCYSAAISSCYRNRQFGQALWLLNKMERRGIEPDLVSFNSVISACGNMGQWQRALSLFAEMEKKGVEHDIFSFSSAISALGKAGHWKQALMLLDKMQRKGIEADDVC